MSFITIISTLASAVFAAYVLEDDYPAESFADMVDFFTVSISLVVVDKDNTNTSLSRTTILPMAMSTTFPSRKPKAPACTTSRMDKSIWESILQTLPLGVVETVCE